MSKRISTANESDTDSKLCPAVFQHCLYHAGKASCSCSEARFPETCAPRSVMCPLPVLLPASLRVAAPTLFEAKVMPNVGPSLTTSFAMAAQVIACPRPMPRGRRGFAFVVPPVRAWIDHTFPEFTRAAPAMSQGGLTSFAVLVRPGAASARISAESMQERQRENWWLNRSPSLFTQMTSAAGTQIGARAHRANLDLLLRKHSGIEGSI